MSKKVYKTLLKDEYPKSAPILNVEKIFEAYAEQSTPAAYRIFWYYGPEKDQITVVAIIPHP